MFSNVAVCSCNIVVTSKDDMKCFEFYNNTSRIELFLSAIAQKVAFKNLHGTCQGMNVTMSTFKECAYY